MNPEQIATVVDTWRTVSEQPDTLDATLRACLPGPPDHAAWRAAWIVEAVTMLAPLLDRPALFLRSAEHVMRRRGAVTMSELGTDQTALLTALSAVLEPLDRFGEPAQRAWALALKVFEETVAVWCLNPFGDAQQGSER